MGDSVPAFLTLLIIPLTYKYVLKNSYMQCYTCLTSYLHSIAYGVIAGIISYMILNGIPLIIRKLSKERIVPSEYKYSEKWVIPPGSMVPPIMYVSLSRRWYICSFYNIHSLKFMKMKKKHGAKPDEQEMDAVHGDLSPSETNTSMTEKTTASR